MHHDSASSTGREIVSVERGVVCRGWHCRADAPPRQVGLWSLVILYCVAVAPAAVVSFEAAELRDRVHRELAASLSAFGVPGVLEPDGEAH